MLGLEQDGKLKIVPHPEFGIIKFCKRKNLRRINISVKSDSEITVSLPYHVSYDEANKFVIEKSEWIKKTQGEIGKIKPTFFDKTTQFTTRSYKVKLLEHNENYVRRVITNDGFLNIYYPQNVDIKSPKLQKIFRQCVLDTLYFEARQYLPQRVRFLADKYHFKYNQLRIKNNISNLGSCSYQNNINLNLHIMRLSDELIDYVILHELCHTVEKNHGNRFWKLLDSVTDNKARELSKQAKKINTRLI
ncbi:MAG: M48 family metallopeptidase [Prevotellaceae bacterium]|jgi:predicted metal-dependent hydrolase|nr:M48 family metallopeptidase [Prevotellaceae bacterium]